MPDDPKNTQTPTIDFSTFIFSLGSAALINLGATPNPVTKKKEYDLGAAKQSIDLLSLLQEKTKGNLTQDEEKLFENLLHSLRLKYVEELDNKGKKK